MLHHPIKRDSSTNGAPLVIALIASTAVVARCAPVTVVEDGGGEFAIVHSEDAPPFVVAAAGTLYASDGREVARFDVTEMPVDRQEIAVGLNDAGWWKLTIEEAETGVLDDVWINLGDELPQWLSPVPRQALRVRPK